ncbi:hypothetical protein SK128_021748, partial [Halocaridina rubra]
MPLLTSDRDGARTLDLKPQSCRRYRLSHGDYRMLLLQQHRIFLDIRFLDLYIWHSLVPVLRHGLPFLPRARMVAFLRRTCFGRCKRYPERMPLLTSDRDEARTLDLTPGTLSLIFEVEPLQGGLIILQVISFFFLYNHLEAVRVRFEREAQDTEKRGAFILQEVQLLKNQLRAIAEDQRHSYLRVSPSSPPPPPPTPPPYPPPSSASHSQPFLRETNVLPKGVDPTNKRFQSRTKRRASDTSYGVNGDPQEGQLSVQLQGDGNGNRSEADQSWLQLTSYARIP